MGSFKSYQGEEMVFIKPRNKEDGLRIPGTFRLTLQSTSFIATVGGEYHMDNVNVVCTGKDKEFRKRNPEAMVFAMDSS